MFFTPGINILNFEINSKIGVELKLSIANGGNSPFIKGDYIELSIPKAYQESLNIFGTRQTKTFDFYSPFSPTTPVTVNSTSCKVEKESVIKLNDNAYKLRFYMAETCTGGSHIFNVYPMQTPYSQINPFYKVEHFRAGEGTPKATPCENECLVQFRKFLQSSTYAPPTSKLINGEKYRQAIVATTDGSVQFILTKGKDFPKYGGRLKFTLPSWVDTNELVFTNGSSPTTCTSPDIEKDQEGLAEDKYWQLVFKTTLNDGDTVTLTCTKYKNPTYPSISRDFELVILDNEKIPNEILKYQNFFVDGKDLGPQILKSEDITQKYLFRKPGETPVDTLPIKIQTEIDLMMSFEMPFPLQDGDCYLKVQFPKDIPLSADLQRHWAPIYSIFGNKPDGTISAAKSTSFEKDVQDELQSVGDDKKVFNSFQSYSEGNYFILKGCQTKITRQTLVAFKLTKVTTPQSQKTTEPFIFELYKSYSENTLKLDQKILTVTTTIAGNNLSPGVFSFGEFKATIPYIQTPAMHTIKFTVQNKLPLKTKDFDSNILIIMPKIMTITRENNDIINGKELDPTIKVLDRYMKVTPKDITRYKEPKVGCDVRACYLIRHQNFQEVKQGSLIQFQISGTTNQLSSTTAGDFQVITQIEDLGAKELNTFYTIDSGTFDSNFTAQIGGISGVSKLPMTSSSYITWDQKDVVYTINFQLGNYIPKNGAIKVQLPIDVAFVQSPNTNFESKEFSFLKYNDPNDGDGTLLALAKDFVPAGPYKMSFGGMRNPRSLRPTEPFNMSSYDNDFQKIGRGVLDNIRMLEEGTFSDLKVEQADLTNGVSTDYTVTMSASNPFQNGDIFYLTFPKQIQIPKEPICIAQKCLQQISCSSEKTRIIATFQQLNDQCNQSNAVFSYTIKNVINARNTIPTDTFQASWTSIVFQKVSAYSGVPQNLFLTNKEPGELTKQQIINEQSSKDFEVKNEYSFRITPTNPIPSLGVIEIVYPNNVKLDDDDNFYKTCKAQTTTAYVGNTICKLDRTSRTIFIYNVFLELQQSSFLSQFTVSFVMTNPEDNFEQSKDNLSEDQIKQQQYDRSFHFNTYTFNPPKDSKYVTGGYLSSDGKDFVDNIIKSNTIASLKTNNLLYAIDSYKNNDMVAQLKCNAPCYKCLDSDPNYCSECWGTGAKDGYKNYFLQKSAAFSTCQVGCDDGYTTNGNAKHRNTKQMFYECMNCDVMCATCKGQGKVDAETGVQDIGKEKDRSVCLTCAQEFPYLKEEDSSCVVTCGTGYYQKKDQDVCGTCNRDKCQTCQNTPDYCMSCRQDNFVPQDYRDISQIEEYVQNQAALIKNLRSNKKSETVILNQYQRAVIAKTYSKAIQIYSFMDESVQNGTGKINNNLGLESTDGLIAINDETTYREMYRNLTNKYVNPLHSLDNINHQCLEKCPPGFTDVSGICLACQTPCRNCRGQVTRCEICLHDIPQKYIYGTACYEICPKGTAPDDDAFECKGCDAGCAICEPKDTKICTECDDPLYLHKSKCLSVCPVNFRPSFFGKTCEPESSLPIIYFPFWILALLMLSISFAGKFSSKNVSGQHRIFLSFYCWIGVLDIICLWVLVIISLIQGQIWHIIFPLVGLTTNYVINHRYRKLIEELDPPKPKQEDRLDLEEVKIVNQCDINFDKWNQKYLSASKHIRRCTIFVSHKFFQFPFTHFFGYLHCTLRTQDFYSVWEWRDVDVKQYQRGQIGQKMIEKKGEFPYKFIGKLVPKNARGFDEIMMRTEEEAQEVKEELENDKLLEGGEVQEPKESQGSKLLLALSKSGGANSGMLAQFKQEIKKDIDKRIENNYAKKRLSSMFKTISKLDKDNLNPFEYVQHPASYPRKQWQKVPDSRVRDLYRWQMKIDIIFIRLPVIIGNIIVIIANLLGNDVNQHLIEEIEAILFSVVIIFAQIYLSKTWEEQRLPEKMKDNKANYLFRQKRSPNEVNKAFGKYDDDDDDIMPEWGKYLPFYKFNEIFLDNKLEELLNIFGRRQCKSCIDFPTGWDKEEDPRRTNSWPLTRVAEENYLKRGDEFDLIDFQLQNNVYADTAEPTIMFESVARDFSEFGVQVFQFDILNALGRKGGDLLNPSIDQDQTGLYKKSQKKKRGRKNKYYKQIDQEDDEEANQISDDTENDGLDHVKEEDEEDEEEELIKKRKAEEALLTQERRKREEEERKKKEQEDEQKKKAQEEETKKRAQEEAKRKAKEEEDTKKQQKEEQRLLAEEETRQAAEALKLKKEKELREKEQKDYEDRIARELLEAQRKQAAEEEALKQQIVRDHSPTKALDENFGKVKVQQDALNFYKDQNKKGTIEAPPNLESRKFNECDIIGDLDRDEKGNVIHLAQAEDQYFDKQGRQTNQRGYLVDKNGNLVNNLDGSRMFPKEQLDERGEVPAPFNLEKYNFNPHHVRGDFDFDKNGKAVVITKKVPGAQASPGQTEITLDKRSSKVTSRGFRIDQHGNMIDNRGRKMFDKSHMTPDGDLPKMFNYNGRRFDINDCIGQLDKDANGEIIPQTDRNGNLVDNLGRRINTRGYLIDEQGNIIDKEGRQIFEKKHLKNDEIPKLFPFTKFNLKNILGDFEMDPLGNPMLSKNQKGQLIDSQGRVVNQKGYLIDQNGNVINKNDRIMFGKELLDQEGDIPKVFRTGLLKSDTASSLSRLMSEIEKNQLSDFDQEERRIQEEIENQLRRPKGNSGNTSVDSMMEDTPANYNAENQRFDTNKRGGLPPNIQNASGSEEEAYGTEEDEMNGGMMGMTGMTNKTGQLVAFDLKKKKKKKKKRKPKPVEYEDPSLRDHLMAGAYGGVAKPKIKRQGVKYTTNIDAGLREIITPGSAFRRDPSNRVGLTINRSQVSDVGSQLGSRIGKRGATEGTSQLLDPQQREAQLKAQQLEEIRKRKIARAKQLKAEGKIGKISKDVDFEKMFGKDIDEFLEDSEWDIESIDKMSQFSKGSKVSIRSQSQTNKLKGLEKVYLQRIEPAGPQKAMRNTGMVGQQQKVAKKANFRGDGDNESVNSRNPKNPAGNRKKAWDTQSRTSNISLSRR